MAKYYYPDFDELMSLSDCERRDFVDGDWTDWREVSIEPNRLYFQSESTEYRVKAFDEYDMESLDFQPSKIVIDDMSIGGYVKDNLAVTRVFGNYNILIKNGDAYDTAFSGKIRSKKEFEQLINSIK